MLVAGRSACAITRKESICQPASFLSAKISPDGNSILKVGADLSGSPNAFIAFVREELVWKQLTFLRDAVIMQMFWSADSKKALFLVYEKNKGEVHFYGVDALLGESVCYTKDFSNVQTKVYKVSATDNRILLGINERSSVFHDLYLLDLDSSSLSLAVENSSYAAFLVSNSLDIILKTKIEKDGSWSVFLSDDSLFLQLCAEDAFQTEFLSYNKETGSVYLLDNRFSDTTQLIEKSIHFPFEEKTYTELEESDIDDTIFLGSVPVAFASYYTKKKWYLLDSAITRDIALLEQSLGEGFQVISQDGKGEKWIVKSSRPHQETSFWLYNRPLYSLRQISNNDATKKGHGKMYPLVVQARDGKDLVCYYTLPNEKDLGGYVKEPIALVVVPHGGPFKVRDKWEPDPYHEWLCSLGYAVLSVNFRLSSGFGKSFVNAGNGEWGKNAHFDVIDAVEACIEKGITKRGQLAILGGSYGGYEALSSLVFSPGYFTCAVAICGPSHLQTVLASVPEFWEFSDQPLSDRMLLFTKQAFITSMGGDPETKEGAAYLSTCSPLNYIENIQDPLLLMHGEKDHVVAERESRQIYEKMKKEGKKVIYILFAKEGHRFSSMVNKLFALDQAEHFLAKYLGGRYEPLEKKQLEEASASIFSEDA